MATPTAHLPLPLTMSISFNGGTYDVATVEVPIPITTHQSSPGSIALAVDTAEMEAALRRAVSAFDDAFHSKES